MEKLNYNFEEKLKSVGQMQIIRNKKATLYFDSEAYPKLSKDYQSGPLSFEYLSDDEKIITNCGLEEKFQKKLN